MGAAYFATPHRQKDSNGYLDAATLLKFKDTSVSKSAEGRSVQYHALWVLQQTFIVMAAVRLG